MKYPKTQTMAKNPDLVYQRCSVITLRPQFRSRSYLVFNYQEAVCCLCLWRL